MLRIVPNGRPNAHYSSQGWREASWDDHVLVDSSVEIVVREKEDSPPIPSVFLCLSGGGLRASLFHYGCLKRMHELGLLGKVYGVSATSGGAVVAALLPQCEVGFDATTASFLYDWDKLEREILDIAKHGVIAPVAKVVAALGAYLAALASYLFEFAVASSPPWTAVALAAGGVALHLAVVRDLWYQPDPRIAADVGLKKEPEPAAPSIPRRFRAMLLATLRPSHVRLDALNARAYRGLRLKHLSSVPRIFLNAVDLNSGRQAAFSQGHSRGLVCGFDPVGCRALWEGLPWRASDEASEVELAAAVAASSAFPPVFRPVSVSNAGELKGVYTDGGVLDNYAVKLPEALGVHIHPARGQRYRPGGGGLRSFQDHTKLVLVLDGSSELVPKHKRRWSRTRALFRIVGTMTNEHSSDAAIVAYNLERNLGVKSAIVGLRSGFPDDGVLSHYIGRIRTHMDAFSLQECAVLAYSGYCSIEAFVRDLPSVLDRTGVSRHAARELRSLREILPDDAGSWSDDREAILNHLRASRHRLALLRTLRRAIRL